MIRKLVPIQLIIIVLLYFLPSPILGEENFSKNFSGKKEIPWPGTWYYCSESQFFPLGGTYTSGIFRLEGSIQTGFGGGIGGVLWYGNDRQFGHAFDTVDSVKVFECPLRPNMPYDTIELAASGWYSYGLPIEWDVKCTITGAVRVGSITTILESLSVEPATLIKGTGTVKITAKTNQSANVKFTYWPSGGSESDIDAVQTNSENKAIIPAWKAGELPTGTYTIKAQISGETSSKTAQLTISEPNEPKITIDLTTKPDTLWVSGAVGSGIFFKAKTTKEVAITLKVKGLDGTEYSIQTQKAGGSGSFITKGGWWGNGDKDLPAGIYWVIATGEGAKTASVPFTVVRIKDEHVLGLGTWLLNKIAGKELAPKPEAGFCPPPDPWDAVAGRGKGYFGGLAAGDPVNITMGNFIHPQVDLTLKAGHSLVLARFYNSLDPAITQFGRGWSSPYLSRLEFLATDVMFIDSDGSRVLFSKQGSIFTPPEGIDLKLSLATDTNYWALTIPSGGEWTFDSSGKLLRIAKMCCGRGYTDAVTVDYDSDGKLSRVSNPAGQWFQFAHNPQGYISQVTDSSGRTITYSYANDNLMSFVDPMGRTTSYTFSEDDLLTKIAEPGGKITQLTYNNYRVSSVTAPDGGVSQFVWDFNNPKLTLTDTIGTVHEYLFSSDWRFVGYSMPSSGIANSFVSSGPALTGYSNAQGAQETYTYGSDGLVQSITDAMGNTSNYEYHPTFHRLTKKRDALGREWRYVWCRRGNLLSEIDPAGGVTSFTYDVHNNKTSRTDQMGRVTRWIYEQTGNYLVQTIDPENGISSFSYDNRGNLVSSSDTLGRTTMFQYDLLDRLTKSISPDGRFVEIEYDEAGNVKTRRDNLGRETQYFYDLAGKLIKLIRPDGTIFTYVYNSGGQKISETGPLGGITRFEYNALGLLTRTVYPDGTSETAAYDSESRLISKTNELGHTVGFQYDLLDRLLATVDPTGARWESQYDAVGRKILDKNPLNRVTSYQFDVLDRVTKVTRPDGSFVTSTFDAVGNLLSSVDALGNVWSWSHDKLNRQIQAIQPNGASLTTAFDAAGQVIAETDSLGRITRYAFDNGGRRTATTDALGNVWRNFYDNAGRLTTVRSPMGAVSSMTYDIMDRVISQSDALGNVNSFEFDSAGRRIAKVDTQGRRSIAVFDLRDRITAEVDPEGHTVSYEYNNAGQRVSLTDGANRTWRWEYDSMGRVVAEIDPLGNANRYRFDTAGNRVSWINARNQTTNYTVDSMNRLSQVSYSNGAIATMAYDAEGRELSRSGPAGSVKKTWDSVGNLLSETFGPWGKKWQYSCDLAGNRIQAVDPELNVYKYRFDALNRMTELNPPARGDEIKFVFDADGRLISEDRPGVKTTNIFDLAGRLLELKHERDHGKEKIVASRKYTYSQVGNRLSMTDENNEVTKYFYNNADWLTKAVYPDGQRVSYAFNGAGDRITETIETPTVKKVGHKKVIGTDTAVIPFAYDIAGRLVSRASDTFVFDPDGNQVTAVENGEESRYFWSPDNRLTKVERDIDCDRHGKRKCPKCHPKTISESYAYLPESWKRITRSSDGLQFVSVYDGEDESHEYLVTPKSLTKEWKFGPFCWKPQLPKLQLYREFIGGPGTDDIQATKYHGRYLNHIKDGLGSTIALTNRGGNAVARVNYDAYGNFRWPDKFGHGTAPCKEFDLDDILDRFDGGRSFGFDPDPFHFGRHFGKVFTPYLYTSRRIDGFTGNYFNRNRYLNTKVGRFLSVDPLKFGGGNNLWTYPQNPVIYTDPFGYRWTAVLKETWIDPPWPINEFCGPRWLYLQIKIMNDAVLPRPTLTIDSDAYPPDEMDPKDFLGFVQKMRELDSEHQDAIRKFYYDKKLRDKLLEAEADIKKKMAEAFKDLWKK